MPVISDILKIKYDKNPNCSKEEFLKCFTDVLNKLHQYLYSEEYPSDFEKSYNHRYKLYITSNSNKNDINGDGENIEKRFERC